MATRSVESTVGLTVDCWVYSMELPMVALMVVCWDLLMEMRSAGSLVDWMESQMAIPRVESKVDLKADCLDRSTEMRLAE